MIFPFLYHTVLSFRNFMRRSHLKYLGFLSLLIITAFTACDKIPGDVVENNFVDYLVNELNAPDNFVYSESDSTIITSLKIDNPKSVASVWCSLKLLKNQQVIYDEINLKDDGEIGIDGDSQMGDNIYSGRILMSKTFSSGDYVIEYYVMDNVNLDENNVAKVAVHQFNFNNGKSNKPPVLSDLVMPASVNKNEVFIITIKASDPDGPQDISDVSFNLYQPSGAFIGKFSLLDDGNTSVDGDVTAGDGIFSSRRSFKTDVTSGTWKFEFIAKDFPGESSNVITFNLTVN